MRNLGISEGNITGRGKKKTPTQNRHLTATPVEKQQTLSSTTSTWGLDREALAALLRVRTGPECPGGNLRELTCDSTIDCGIDIP